jgi:uncharacterized protein (DUF2062 family)
MRIIRRLKRWLPDVKRLGQEPGLSRIQGYVLNPLLWQFNRKSVARGAAIGLFIAFLPLPLQMWVAAILAIVFIANLPIAIALTWVTNPFTFLPINYFIYKVGQLIIHDGSSYHIVSDFKFSGQSWQNALQQFFHWLHTVGKSFLVGLPVVAIGGSIIGYTFVQVMWRLVIYWRLCRRKKIKWFNLRARRDSSSRPTDS